MRYEQIKSILLIVLVAISVILTFNLWTYQPKLEELKSKNTVQGVTISKTQEEKSIVRPNKVIFHADDVHYGTINSGLISKMIDSISGWTYEEITNITQQVENFNTFSQENGMVEIIFPNTVPMDLYRSVLQLKDNNPPALQFDEIVIRMEVDNSHGMVYFLDTKTKNIYQSLVPAAFITNFRSGFYNDVQNNEKFTKYFPVTVAEQRTIYLPEQETKLMKYEYIRNEIDSAKFRDALFSDPSLVQKNFIAFGEEYSDSTSLMRVQKDQNIVSYIKPEQENQRTSTHGILKRSIDFINDHGGWTDLYRYVELNELRQSVRFRLYNTDGYPVFNENGLSEIGVAWGNEEIYEYKRNNFILGIQNKIGETIVPSGEEAYEMVKNIKDFNPELLQDMVIGYQMTRVASEQLVKLEPAWYFRYNNRWIILSQHEQGGENLGLE
ncbi:hypothetical protein J9303_06965 [Bacillaceae bacterium Marseille-Q3522]|nr:hypothetical protein [Bacillaceae bacterium Marseille-Q3522]